MERGLKVSITLYINSGEPLRRTMLYARPRAVLPRANTFMYLKDRSKIQDTTPKLCSVILFIVMLAANKPILPAWWYRGPAWDSMCRDPRCGRRFSFIPSRYGAWRKHSPTTLPDQGRSVKDPVCHFILLRPLFHSSNRPAIAQWQ